MRALNEGDVGITTLVRLADRALAQVRISGAARDARRRRHACAQILRERELAFLHPVVALDRRPGGAHHGHGRRQSVRALAVRRSHRRRCWRSTRRFRCRAAMARATWRSRSSWPGAIAPPGTLVLGVSFERPASPDAFRYRKIARVKPKGASVVSIAAHVPNMRRPRRRRAHRLWRAWRRRPIRAKAAERALEGRALDEAGVAAAVAAAAEGTSPADRRDRQRLVSARGRRRPSAPPAARPGGLRRAERMAKTAAAIPSQRPRGRGLRRRRRPICSRRLRDLVGDHSPKFGCGQGGCGACTVLIDGDARPLLRDAGRERRRPLDRDGRRPQERARTCIRCRRAFMEHFAAQCGYCTPGMLMAAKALLDRNPSPSRSRGRRGDLRQHLPLHRLRTDHQRRCSPPPGAARGAPERHEPCLNCARTFSPTSATTISRKSASRPSARTCSAMSPRRRPSSTITSCRACCI